MSENKYEKFRECLYKMDKWAVEDQDTQDEFYEIIESDLPFEEKVDEIHGFLDVMVGDWERLNSYMQDADGNPIEYTHEELAEAIVNSNQ